VYVTLIVSPEVTVLEPAVNAPMLNKVPVVLSIAVDPPTLMNAPYTVPELVMLNTTAALVDRTAGLAVVEAEKLGVLRVPE
jgi:hypothetical protein